MYSVKNSHHPNNTVPDRITSLSVSNDHSGWLWTIASSQGDYFKSKFECETWCEKYKSASFGGLQCMRWVFQTITPTSVKNSVRNTKMISNPCGSHTKSQRVPAPGYSCESNFWQFVCVESFKWSLQWVWTIASSQRDDFGISVKLRVPRTSRADFWL